MRTLVEYHEHLLQLDKKLELVIGQGDTDEADKIKTEMAVIELMMRSDIGDESLTQMRDSLAYTHITVDDMLRFHRHRAWIDALNWIIAGEYTNLD